MPLWWAYKKTVKSMLLTVFHIVVPPGIVIYTQVALYLHFEELPNPQSPPIAPPQNCVVLRIVKTDDFAWQRYNFRVRNRKD